MGSGVLLPTPGQPATGPDPNFKSASIPKVVSFGLDRIEPPSPLYVERDDILTIVMNTQAVAGDTVTFVARLLEAAPDFAGQPDRPPIEAVPAPGPARTQNIKVMAFTLTINVQGVRSLQIPMQEGFLLSVCAASSTQASRGLTFVRAHITRGPANNQTFHLQLLADYATNNYQPSWPAGRQISSTESTGFLGSVQVPNPGAGLDWTFTVAPLRRVRLMSLEAQLAVANSGAARPVEIIVDDGVNIVARMATNTAAPINATANVNFSNNGTPSTSIPSDLYAQAPAALYLPSGFRIRSLTTNIVAGDTWTNIWLLLEQWIDQ